MGKNKWNSEQDIEAQLKQAILKSGISRYKLSQMTGVPASVLCTFVNGKRSITMVTAAKLAKALGLHLKPIKKGRK
jgi:plasmid maintenance system antidote protein VapI